MVPILNHVDIGEGGFYGPSSADAPLSDGHALDEIELEGVGGLERINIILLQLFKKGVIFIAEDDRSSGESVFQGIHG